MNNQIKFLTDNQKDFLKFLKSKYHLYHLSNVFFRDMHYGVMAYLSLNNMEHRYSKSEELTRRVVESLERANILRNVGGLAWLLLYPEFKKPLVKPAAPAKPAVPTAKPAAPAAPGVPPKLAAPSLAPHQGEASQG